MPDDPRDPADEALEVLYHSSPSLNLGALDISFLCLLQSLASLRGLTAFTEEQLLEVFGGLCRRVLPEAEAVATRATHTLRRLREQQLLVRVDGAGVLRSGDYTLSRLAAGICDHYSAAEPLTAQSLETLARTLLSSLQEARGNALAARRDDQWRAGVTSVLRVTTSELILGIERRQRSLDAQQEEFQRRISSLLEADWFEAVSRCQLLLDEMADTLRQLAQLLLSYVRSFEEAVQDIVEAAAAAGQSSAEAAAQAVLGQLDRMVAWGSARQRAWSDYYEHVHRYLRDVVRLDPSRALTQRLRQQLNEHGEGSFALTVAAPQQLVVPRALRPLEPPPPIKRPKGPRRAPEPLPEKVEVHPLEDRVRQWISEGVRTLDELTERATSDIADEGERFRVAGRVAELAGQLPEAQGSAPVRPWVPVGEHLQIEQWELADILPEQQVTDE